MKKSKAKKPTRKSPARKIKQKKASKPKPEFYDGEEHNEEEIIVHQENIPHEIISDYVFSFELCKQYPTVRSYLLKQPLKKSFKETFFDLFGTGKKV